MPRTRSVLSGSRRIGFGAWLDVLRQQRGLSKKALAEALGRPGGATNRQINKYLSGEIAASESTLIALARALELPERYMLLAGGYFEPLIRDIEDLLALAQWYCILDGLSFHDCIEGRPVAVSQQSLEPSSIAPYMQIQISRKYTVPAPAIAAVHIALLAFPLRGERYNDDTLPGIFVSYDPRGFRRRPGKMPSELSKAINGLSDQSLSGNSRRAVAAEYVRAWITRECGPLASDLARVMYEPACVPSVPDIRVDLTPIPLERSGRGSLNAYDEKSAPPTSPKESR